MTGHATIGWARIVRPAAFAAALVAGLGSGLAAGGAAAETRADGAAAVGQLARIMSRELAAMDAVGASRIEELAGARAAAASTVTVAARQADLTTAEPPASAAPKRLDFAALDGMALASGDGEFQCLAEAVYFESRGEPLAGQFGVAEVVLNRVDSSQYPGTVCGVTRQGAGGGGGCQFSYACDGRSDAMTSGVARSRAEKIARMMLDGRARDVTDGATNFHATYVRPAWSRTFTRTAAIGAHIFYRQPTRVAQR